MTPRSRLVSLDLSGHPFEFAPGQAVVVGKHGPQVGARLGVHTGLRGEEVGTLVGV